MSIHHRFISVKKAAIVLVVALQLIVLAQAQTHRKEYTKVDEFQVKTIDIAWRGDKIQLLNFKGIQVIDARADTARIGFMQKRIISKTSAKLNKDIGIGAEQKIKRLPVFVALEGGVQTAVDLFVNKYTAFSQNDTLPVIVMVIKKLWLSDEFNIDDSIPNNEKGLRAENMDRWASGIDAKIEYYLQRGMDYYALYRYDSLISKASTVEESGPLFIGEALQLSLQKMRILYNKSGSFLFRRRFTIKEIEAHNNDEYNIPILQDKFFKQGVYMSFAEFKNNNPSVSDYEFEDNKIADLLYIRTPDGGKYPERNAWGYCNGKNLFVRAGDNFFILQRVENAFYIYGAKNISRHFQHKLPQPMPGLVGGVAGTIISYRNSRWELPLRPFQLDWTTGKLY